MLLSKNRIKYLASLKIKKFRTLHGQFIMEGDKIVKDALRNKKPGIVQIVATGDWLSENQHILKTSGMEVTESDQVGLSHISALENPPPVLAVFNMQENTPDYDDISGTTSIALDHVQDPGNLGTIIRIADWFGIKHVLCSPGCADQYNPKVIQASMGAILNVQVLYPDLPDLLSQLAGVSGFTICGTFMDGDPVMNIRPIKPGIILFGNESRGISGTLMPFVKQRITIPPGPENPAHVESLNVASSVAIVCAMMNREH